MSAVIIGRVKSGKTNRSFEVKWDSLSKEVYVSWAGWTYIGNSYSSGNAMNQAESWLYNK